MPTNVVRWSKWVWLGTVIVLAGCTSAGPDGEAPIRKVHSVPEDQQLKLAFITNNAGEFWKIAEKGLQKAKAAHGITVDLKIPNPETIEGQNAILEDLESQGYHGIAISVLAPDDQIRAINAAAASANVITHDSDAPQSNRLAYIGTNNFEAGRVLGKEICRLLPEGGTLAVFVGTLSADNARQRLAGIEKEIEESKLPIRVVAKKEDNKDMGRARANVEDVLNSHPDITLLVGLWSYNGPQILSAVRAAKMEGKVKIACFDEEDLTLEGIHAGAIDASVVQRPFEFGYQSALLLEALCRKGEAALPENPLIDTGVELITKDNVAEFQARLAELKQ